MMRSVDIVVGLQWGSEAKGRFAAALAPDYNAAVRVGGPNAGHTFWHEGKRYVNRCLPCAWVNPECELFIGAGAIVDLHTLACELHDCEASGLSIASRLTIDPQAVLVNTSDIDAEDALSWMGSTQHGVGAALMRKIARREGSGPLVRHFTNDSDILILQHEDAQWRINVRRVAPFLHEMIIRGASILLEGTQGTLLSLDHGEWPYVTSKNVTAGALCSDCGVAPGDVRRVYGVMRTFPIRVAGPSGPMGNEITWSELARRAGLDVVPDERTTVTNRTRRVAELDIDRLRHAAALNGVDRLCVSFLDYLDGSLQTRAASEFGDLRGLMNASRPVADALPWYASAAGAGVHAVSWGEKPEQSLWEWS